MQEALEIIAEQQQKSDEKKEKLRNQLEQQYGQEYLRLKSKLQVFSPDIKKHKAEIKKLRKQPIMPLENISSTSTLSETQQSIELYKKLIKCYEQPQEPRRKMMVIQMKFYGEEFNDETLDDQLDEAYSKFIDKKIAENSKEELKKMEQQHKKDMDQLKALHNQQEESAKKELEYARKMAYKLEHTNKSEKNKLEKTVETQFLIYKTLLDANLNKRNELLEKQHSAFTDRLDRGRVYSDFKCEHDLFGINIKSSQKILKIKEESEKSLKKSDKEIKKINEELKTIVSDYKNSFFQNKTKKNVLGGCLLGAGGAIGIGMILFMVFPPAALSYAATKAIIIVSYVIGALLAIIGGAILKHDPDKSSASMKITG